MSVRAAAWRALCICTAFLGGVVVGRVGLALALPRPSWVLCVEDEQEIWCAPAEPADVARVLAESASEAGDTEMAMGEFAYGKAKGMSFDQGATEDLEWYLKTQKERLTKEPDGKYARYQQKDISEIESILKQRNGGAGGAAIVPAGNGGAQVVRRAPAEVRQIEGTYHRPKEVRGALEQAAAMGHLVTPATGCSDLPEGCSIALSVVYVDVGAETYDVGGGKRGLSKSALQKLGNAAGISWDATQSGRLDNGADRNYCLWKAVGTYRKFDGSEVQLLANKEMDLRDGSAQLDALYDRYEAGRKKHEEWVAKGRNGREPNLPKEPTGQIREMRLHIAAHAETKAQLRATRSLGIRSAYTVEELQRPFIVAQLMFTGRTDNLVLAEKFATLRATTMLGGAKALYGVAPTGAGFAPVPPQLIAPPPLRRVLDEDDLPPPSDPEPQGPPVEPTPAGPPTPAAASPAREETPAPVVTTPDAPPRRASGGARRSTRTGADTLPFDEPSGPPAGWVDPEQDGR